MMYFTMQAVNYISICTFLSLDGQIVTVHLKASVLSHNEENEDEILKALSSVSTYNLHPICFIQLQYHKKQHMNYIHMWLAK